MNRQDLDQLNQVITGCELCPRLRAWCCEIAREKKKAYRDWDYWGLPIPNFGDPNATRLIVGLAPAAHGANRTGRMFTGDRSGEWLYRALHKAGVANQLHTENPNDGLQLKSVLITAVVHCAPPDNKPLPSEIQNCHAYLRQMLNCRNWEAILCLGSIAWNEVLRAMEVKPRPAFAHGAEIELPNKSLLLGSYHPSQQNTFTGRLTETMLDSVIAYFISKSYSP